MMKCLIIDDELIARKGIEKYIQEISFLSVAGSVRSAADASGQLNTDIELLILDINLPQVNGLEFLKNLTEPPITIIITAYPEYALKGYELDVIDYIVKPVSFERFLKACTKAREYNELLKRKALSATSDYIFIKADGRLEKIYLDDILYIEAKENYSAVYCTYEKYLTLTGLGNMLELLNNNNFVRVHKSYIIALNKITGMNGDFVMIGKIKIPISRNVKAEVKELLLKTK